MNTFYLLTSATYWLLIVMWAYILFFYIRRIGLKRVESRLLITLIVILAIDAFRTLFESFYFGAWYTSLAGLLPMGVHDFLSSPERWVIPKFLNVAAAALIIGILLRRWLPEEEHEREQQEKHVRKLTETIEKRKRAEEELVQANIQLKEMDRIKSEFLATMSHELRTPLNSIIGFTGIMLQGIPGELNEEQRKQLSMVNNSAKHLLGLINDILDLSRIESSKMETSTERFKIQDVVSEVAQSLSPMISQKGLRLITEIPDETPEIYSDRKKVSQVLLNLVNNAVKFTQAGEVRIECKFDNDNLEVSVADTGIGIKKEAMELLFEAFRQIDGTARRRYQGAGLGLYLCQKLVTLLGGNIWAESEYGRGSRFTFTLPLKRGERGKIT
jgi:signal transduction histidine kinase